MSATGALAADLLDQIRLSVTGSCPRCDLSGMDLSGVGLADADLSEADLRDTRLVSADLRAASLRDADLSRADLRGANLEGASLDGAVLREANLEGAVVSNASFVGADLSDAVLGSLDPPSNDPTGATGLEPGISRGRQEASRAGADATDDPGSSDGSGGEMATGPRAADPPLEPTAGRVLVVELVDLVQLPASSSTPPLARLSHLCPAADGSGLLFAGDMNGRIYALRGRRLLLPPFLDIAALRGPFFQAEEFEIGLATFAFHPDFGREGEPGYGRLYTAHTERDSLPTGVPAPRVFDSPTGEIDHFDVLTEWSVDPSDPTRVDPMSHREILRIAQPYKDHNVGQLAFNPNTRPGEEDYGLLYISVGDGGDTISWGRVDELGLAQSRKEPFGKILRIDPLQNGAASYRVPEQNPFVQEPDSLPEIWALGLRNPQRFSWDSGEPGRMLIADIGQANMEEVNLGAAGANYGWSLREGTFTVDHDDELERLPLPADDAQLGLTYPVAQYGRDKGRAISGGFVYRGKKVPDLYGMYVFGDIATGRIFYFNADQIVDGRQAEIHELTLIHRGEQRTLLEILGDETRADLRFGRDEEGELYVLTKRDGFIRRIQAWSKPWALR